MSSEAETATESAPAPVIMPAKSEDKLEIEKEEKERINEESNNKKNEEENGDSKKDGDDEKKDEEKKDKDEGEKEKKEEVDEEEGAKGKSETQQQPTGKKNQNKKNRNRKNKNKNNKKDAANKKDEEPGFFSKLLGGKEEKPKEEPEKGEEMKEMEKKDEDKKEENKEKKKETEEETSKVKDEDKTEEQKNEKDELKKEEAETEEKKDEEKKVEEEEEKPKAEESAKKEEKVPGFFDNLKAMTTRVKKRARSASRGREKNKEKAEKEEGATKDEKDGEKDDEEKEKLIKDEEDKEKEEDGEKKEESKEPAGPSRGRQVLQNLKEMTGKIKKRARSASKKRESNKEKAEEEKKDEEKENLIKDGDDDAEEKKDEKAEGEKEETEKEEKEKEEEKAKEEEEKPQASGGGFFASIKSFFAGSKLEQSQDVEAGGGKEEDKEDDEKKELIEGDDVKSESKKESDEEEIKKSEAGDEKEEKKSTDKDVEAGGGDGDGEEIEPKEIKECQFNRLKGDAYRRFEELNTTQKSGLAGIILGIFVLVLILIILAIVGTGSWTNEARLVQGGKYIETITSCGKVQGIVDGKNRFSFYGIPYAAPISGSDRWTHSHVPNSIEECSAGNETLVAHYNGTQDEVNEQRVRCIFQAPGAKEADGVEDCLRLDIHTSNVVYSGLMPVVVYLEDDVFDPKLQPTSALASKHGVVFVRVSFRRGALGFLSLQSLAQKAYPMSAGNYGLGDIITALKWLSINVQHFGGHPGKITVLGRGTGATLAPTLTAAPSAVGLFQRVWAISGTSAYLNETLEMANRNNKNFLISLNCDGKDLDCLYDAAASEVARAASTAFTNLPDDGKPPLPLKDELTTRSLLTIDKEVLTANPMTFWRRHQLHNTIPMVFGTTAQSAATAANFKEVDNWNNTDAVAAIVEERLGSFNVSLPGSAIKVYNSSSENGVDNWTLYSKMLSDVRRVCPMLELANDISENFVANVYGYVVTMPRKTEDRGTLAYDGLDLEAIFDVLNDQSDLQTNLEGLFYKFVKDGVLGEVDEKGEDTAEDITRATYLLDYKNVETVAQYPNCEFWKKAYGIVPDYGYIY